MDASDVVGAWHGTVTRPDVVEPNRITFHADGTLLLTAGEQGGGGRGDGEWRLTDSGELAWTCHEELHGPDGTPFGHVEIDQRGSVTGGVLATSGVSRVFDLDGVQRYAVEVRVDATRSAATDPPA